MAASRLRVICGATAAGKSAIATALALEYTGTLISADSRQVYRGFDIGTAKPSPAELKAVPHRGVDIVAPTERYSASEWGKSAAGWADEAVRGGRVPVIVGGTGFYIKALIEPLFESPELDSTRRASFEAYASALSVSELRRWCRALDPARADLGRTQLTRAVEVAVLTGRRISDLHVDRARPATIGASYLVVDPGASLHTRIARRVDEMLDAGWQREVEGLAHSIPASSPAWKASGYRTMLRVVHGDVDLSSARKRIIIETRQYAKRQRTWFRHQLGDAPVTHVDPGQPDWQAIVHRWWKESS